MRKFFMFFSLAVCLVAGLVSVVYMTTFSETYDGSQIDVLELYNDPSAYDVNSADGIASIIVMEDLQKTKSANVVSAVVFDYRGYDTIGESFVLITAISGAMVILRKSKKKEVEKR